MGAAAVPSIPSFDCIFPSSLDLGFEFPIDPAVLSADTILTDLPADLPSAEDLAFFDDADNQTLAFFPPLVLPVFDAQPATPECVKPESGPIRHRKKKTPASAERKADPAYQRYRERNNRYAALNRERKRQMTSDDSAQLVHLSKRTMDLRGECSALRSEVDALLAMVRARVAMA